MSPQLITPTQAPESVIGAPGMVTTTLTLIPHSLSTTESHGEHRSYHREHFTSTGREHRENTERLCQACSVQFTLATAAAERRNEQRRSVGSETCQPPREGSVGIARRPERADGRTLLALLRLTSY